MTITTIIVYGLIYCIGIGATGAILYSDRAADGTLFDDPIPFFACLLFPAALPMIASFRGVLALRAWRQRSKLPKAEVVDRGAL